MKTKMSILEALKYKAFGMMPKCDGPAFRQEQLDSAKRKYTLLSHNIRVTSQINSK